jgi:heme/copper-type cytochrome/quinol oxidase subunit 2
MRCQRRCAALAALSFIAAPVSGAQQQRIATTANEIHVPVGRAVQFSLRSDNVIHSVWGLRLHGKLDLVPRQENVAWFTADEADVYRGQCAESIPTASRGHVNDA